MIIALNAVRILAVRSAPWPGSLCGIRIAGAGRPASLRVRCVLKFGRSAAGGLLGFWCGLCGVLVPWWQCRLSCGCGRGVSCAVTFRGLCWGFGVRWSLAGLGRCTVCFWGAGCLASLVRVSCVGPVVGWGGRLGSGWCSFEFAHSIFGHLVFTFKKFLFDYKVHFVI